jgi:hypothetical protein
MTYAMTFLLKIFGLKDKKNMVSLSMYFMKAGNVIVKCSYAENGRSLADCFLSYLENKVMLLD